MICYQISTSAGWSDVFEAISFEDTKDCEMPNVDTGDSGTCGNVVLSYVFMILYLIFSFLIIVNMYIAVILQNYGQVNIFYFKLNSTNYFAVSKRRF